MTQQTTSSSTLLDVCDLTVSFNTNDGQVTAVKGVSMHINAGECVGIVGESGSGKSQTFMAAMGLLAKNASATGQILYQGRDLLSLDTRYLNTIRGSDMSMIFQDPLTSLAPHIRIGEQMVEVLETHRNMRKSQAKQLAIDWLSRVKIPEAERRFRQYPHELSGGMRQRVMIAIAMLCEPKLLIADEPTTALDVTVQSEILDLLKNLQQEHKLGIALITHDMGVVARMCDRIQVMKKGEYVESGTADEIFYQPKHDYTKMLINAMPRVDEPERTGHQQVPAYQAPTSEDASAASKELIVKDLSVVFPIKQSKGFKRITRHLQAVDQVSFTLRHGETLGVVGESGCGKSTLSRAILQLIKPSDGSVSWLGSHLTTADQQTMKSMRRDLQIVFQDPLASLNPRLTIGESIMEPLKTHRQDLSKSERREMVKDMMEKTGLDANMINRYPHELSGGQNQRVGIARAIILNPQLLICDEAVSALDVSIQGQIIALLIDIQQRLNLSVIFISHDLSVVRLISHRIMVLYLGRIVEMGHRDQVMQHPQHPYTKQLISAVPVPDPEAERQRKRIYLQGELSSPLDPQAALRFMPSKLAAGDEDYRPKLLSKHSDGEEPHWVAEHDPIETLLRT